MKRQDAEKAIKLVNEITSLKQYVKMTKNYNTKCMTFRIMGLDNSIVNPFSPVPPLYIEIDNRHNKRLLAVVDEIIAELEKELEEL